jgi:hypothetical protein
VFVLFVRLLVFLYWSFVWVYTHYEGEMTVTGFIMGMYMYNSSLDSHETSDSANASVHEAHKEEAAKEL